MTSPTSESLLCSPKVLGQDFGITSRVAWQASAFGDIGCVYFLRTGTAHI